MDKMDKEEKNQLLEESWDKKKIAIAFIFFLFFAGGAFAAKKYFFPSFGDQLLQKPPMTAVEGTSTKNDQNTGDTSQTNPTPPFSLSSQDIQANIQQKVTSLQDQVKGLSVDDIASSSPQIQKVINDIKSLQNYPKSQAKEMCENMCKSL